MYWWIDGIMVEHQKCVISDSPMDDCRVETLCRFLTPDMELGHRVSDFGQVGSGQRSVCQTWCLTWF